MPPKHPRGLLGVPKDPKNQVLFSFTGESWPSDDEDSDDSDYVPPGDPAENGAGRGGNKKDNIHGQSDDEDYVPPGIPQKGTSTKRRKGARGGDSKGKLDCKTAGSVQDGPAAKPNTRPRRNVKRIRIFADSDSYDSSESSSSGSSDEELSDLPEKKVKDVPKRESEQVIKNKRITRSRSAGSQILDIVESEHDYISSPEKEEKPKDVEYSSEVEEEEKAILKHDHDYAELSEAGPSTDNHGITSKQTGENEAFNSGESEATCHSSGGNLKKRESLQKSTPQDKDTPKSISGKQKKKTGKKIVRFKDIPEDKNPVERKRKRVKSRKDSGSNEGSPLWGQQLPVEVIVKILQFAVADQGAVPLLCRVAKVCHFWHEASKHPSLWHHVDLSTGHILPNARSDKTLQWLAKKRFSQLRSLNLSHWVFLTKQGIQHLASSCPALQHIRLFRCGNLTAEGITLLADRCPNLTNLDLSGVKAVAERCPQLESVDLTKCIKIGPEGVVALADRCTKLCKIQLSSAQSHMVSPTCLKHVLEKTSPRLKELNLSSNKLVGLPGVFKSIARCPLLEVLDMSNCNFSTTPLFPIEALQTGCPQLRVLRFAGSAIAAGNASTAVQEQSPGFPELHEVSLASNTLLTAATINDSFLRRLLKTSYKLKLLDLRGCAYVSKHGLQCLPVTCLEHFFVSNTNTYNYEGIEAIIQKCQHSLVEMDLSWNVYPVEALEGALKKLSSSRNTSQLKVLNLSGTCVTTDMVRCVVEGCPHLTSLNLTSCRALPRGMKQLFGEEAIAELRRNSANMFGSTSDL